MPGSNYKQCFILGGERHLLILDICVSLKIFVCSTFAESTYLALGVLRKQSMLLCHVRFNEILRFMDPQILQRDTGLASGIRTEED